MISWKNFVTSAVLFGLFTLAAASAVFAADLNVVIRSQAEVQDDTIRLKDVADISGPDGAFKNDLSSISITRAPEPGKQVKIRQAYLVNRLKASGLPLDMAAWTLPEEILVTRTSQEIDEPWLQGIVEDFLAGQEPYASSDWKLVYTRFGKLPALPAGNLEYRVTSNNSTNPAHISLTVYLSVDGQEVDKIRVTGKVDLNMRALVAAKSLERGALIHPEDVRLDMVNISLLRSGAVTELDRVEGLSVRRNLQPGQPILSKDLYRQDVVQRGEIVTIVAQSGPLKITARGQAKQNGAVGDTISVTNMASDKTVAAKIVNANTVEVTFQS